MLLKDEQGLELYVRDGDKVRRAGKLQAGIVAEGGDQISRQALRNAVRDRAVVLRLSAGDVVERVIQIPKAASDVLEPVLNNQLARIVPWPPQSTRFGYRVVGPNATAPDQIDVQLVATTIAVIESALQQARAHGLTPCAVDYGLEPQALAGIELMPLTPDPIERAAKRLHTGLRLCLAASIMAGAAGCYLLWQRETQFSELTSKVAAARTGVEQLKNLHEENRRLKELHGRLINRKSGETATVVLIEALSRIIPDTSYLTAIEMHDRDIRMTGRSDDPTALIAKLEASPEFEDVRFSAPTTRDEGATLTTFSIIARTELSPKKVGHQP